MQAPDKALDVHMDATGLTSPAPPATRFHYDVPGSCHAPTAKDANGCPFMRGQRRSPQPGHLRELPRQRSASRPMRPLNRMPPSWPARPAHPQLARGGVPPRWDWDGPPPASAMRRASTSPERTPRPHHLRIAQAATSCSASTSSPSTWFNGTVKLHTLWATRSTRASSRSRSTTWKAALTTAKSMIWPMKVFRQAAVPDPVNQTLVTPHTAGNDDTGYWKNLVWDKAIEVGMKDSGAFPPAKVDFAPRWLSPADHPHGRPEGEGAGLRRVPRPRRRSPGRHPGRHPEPRRQRLGRRIGWTAWWPPQ